MKIWTICLMSLMSKLIIESLFQPLTIKRKSSHNKSNTKSTNNKPQISLNNPHKSNHKPSPKHNPITKSHKQPTKTRATVSATSSIGANVLSRNKLLRALETRLRRKGEKEYLATVRFILELKMITMWMKTVSTPVDMAESHLSRFTSLKDKR
jgi:hypothetical protein